VYGLIAGGHSFYGTHSRAPGCDNWGKFMTRWSGFLWDLRLRPMADPRSRITVKAPGSVFWEPLVQERVADPTRRFLIVHLVKPSPNDVISDTVVPPPLEDVEVDLKRFPAEQVRRVVLVRPEAEPYAAELVTTRVADATRVRIPRLTVWAM